MALFSGSRSKLLWIGLLCCAVSSIPARSERVKSAEGLSVRHETALAENHGPIVGITGGVKVKFGSIPWMAALYSERKLVQHAPPFCGGSLITEFHVLSAAHCLCINGTEVPKPKEEIVVALGLHDWWDNPAYTRIPPFIFGVDKVIRHIGYRVSGPRNDIGLLRLGGKVDTSGRHGLKIRTIALPKYSYSDYEIKRANVSGWGAQEREGNDTFRYLSSELHRVSVSIVNRTKCEEMYSKSRKHLGHSLTVHDYNICARDKHTRGDFCRGDSGGPLFVMPTENVKDSILIGIVSAGTCYGRLPGLYVSVFAYRDWIKVNLKR